MWASTHSRARNAALAAGLAIALLFPDLHARTMKPPPLPAEVVSTAPGLAPRGGGELRFLGLSIYDGFLWSVVAADPLGGALALDLHYHRNLDGAKIAERSASEIAKLGYGSAEERSRWGAWMQRVFPDVRKGDRLTGVHMPGRGAMFFHNGRPIGEIEDDAFARAFFGIWLDPRTSQPGFRELLLGVR